MEIKHTEQSLDKDTKETKHTEESFDKEIIKIRSYDYVELIILNILIKNPNAKILFVSDFDDTMTTYDDCENDNIMKHHFRERKIHEFR